MKLLVALFLNLALTVFSNNTLATSLVEVTLKMRKPATANTQRATELSSNFAQMPPIEIVPKKFSTGTEIKRKN